MDLLSRSPGHYAPWWVTNWIKRSPLIFLIISAAAFSIGLCAFAYSSNQVRFNCVQNRAMTRSFGSTEYYHVHFDNSIHVNQLCGLVFGHSLVGCEKWTFTHHRGEKWLMQIIDELVNRSPRLLWISKRLSSRIFQSLTFRKERQDRAPSQTSELSDNEKHLETVLPQLKSQDGDASSGAESEAG